MGEISPASRLWPHAGRPRRRAGSPAALLGALGLGPRRLSCACADAGAPRTWQPADPGKRLRGPLALSVAEAAVAYPPTFLGLPARAPCPPSSFATAAVCGRGSCSWLRAAAFECSGGCLVGQGSEHCPCLTHGGGRREEEGLVLRWPPEPGTLEGAAGGAQTIPGSPGRLAP